MAAVKIFSLIKHSVINLPDFESEEVYSEFSGEGGVCDQGISQSKEKYLLHWIFNF